LVFVPLLQFLACLFSVIQAFTAETKVFIREYVVGANR
jgi:hypothetical protein